MVPAPLFEDMMAELDEAKVLRSNRVRAVRCGPILPSWRTPKARGDGISDAPGCRQDPACGGPGGRSTPDLRRRAYDRLAELINADLASVAAAATRAAWAARRPDRGDEGRVAPRR
jgi:hypothetical protein